MCCSELPCVLQHVLQVVLHCACGSVLQQVAVYGRAWQRGAVCVYVLQFVQMCCRVTQYDLYIIHVRVHYGVDTPHMHTSSLTKVTKSCQGSGAVRIVGLQGASRNKRQEGKQRLSLRRVVTR